MTVLKIKTSKPYVEREVKAKDIDSKFTIGIKVYPVSEGRKLLREYSKLAGVTQASKSIKELEELKDNTELSQEELELKFNEISDTIDNLTTEQSEKFDTFYKKHVLFLKNVSLVLEEDGVDKTMSIPDTREAAPIESLWNTPDECLVVLLNLYLDDGFFRDSLINTITSVIFNIDIKGEELKN